MFFFVKIMLMIFSLKKVFLNSNLNKKEEKKIHKFLFILSVCLKFFVIYLFTKFSAKYYRNVILLLHLLVSQQAILISINLKTITKLTKRWCRPTAKTNLGSISGAARRSSSFSLKITSQREWFTRRCTKI